ncbi:tRNA-dihydrouridine synthase [Patulibacter sp.]|uniref:tRNA dihydrouridine synthase n=1 Tax=Patulibacter sp. TaxID=1912859 RepID=UPI00271F9D07|nr:tRNA-dihydrouridine synthase [Patulibacter sp.]MDO9408484.1 tRNA-dihydrouridine synthase [Patulibacter sp.]
MAAAPLTDSWTLGGLTVPNRVTLAPLAGIGNWVVRLQAKRYGAGYAVSEMVSSFAIHHRNEKTLRDLLRFEEAEREHGPVAIQLFGQDPEVMRSAAAYVAEHVAVDVIDLNMGCPVPKVIKTGAGAAMLKDPDTAVAVARAAREGSGLPVTVKLRSSTKKDGETDGYALATRLVDEAGVAAIGFHPRSAQVHHKGTPDYELAARLVQELPVPVVLSGGLHDDAETLAAYEQVAPAAVMLARGALGNPWRFSSLLGLRDDVPPTADEVVTEFEWVLDRTIEHLGAERAGRYLRKHYPWYVERLAEAASAAAGPDAPILPDKELQAALQGSEDIDAARALVRAAATVGTPA